MTEPYFTSDPEALAARAVRFPLRGPISIYDAWDGVALIDFAYRMRLPLGKLRERRCQQAVDVIKDHDSPAAFRLMAVSRLAQYQVMMVRFYLGPETILPTDEEIIRACEMLDRAYKKRRAEQRRRKKLLDAV
ncbi:hypothetical protein CcrColossus_gp322 [Caulobacter phage CcrColossus]|uniref:Uncharacterized protein n=1 Tax=Caulobacter phage CcrColossus TaxID=1211640 RepID=K4K6J9_9CAUD|nr:hypothetical protein CcrColossus_gp322 [Caulobacter phage CcrColossus]AFU88192.1 hypothetical protein CcrColossus_gp322 [Caulobacter phage CcrColossus]